MGIARHIKYVRLGFCQQFMETQRACRYIVLLLGQAVQPLDIVMPADTGQFYLYATTICCGMGFCPATCSHEHRFHFSHGFPPAKIRSCLSQLSSTTYQDVVAQQLI